MAVQEGGSRQGTVTDRVLGFFRDDLVDVEKELETEASNEIRNRMSGDSAVSYISDYISSTIEGPEPRNSPGQEELERRKSQEDFTVQAGGFSFGPTEGAIVAGLALLTWVAS